MPFYGPFARLLRVGYRAIHPRWRVEMDDLPEGPVVYVIHHQNMFGPVHAIGLLPQEAHMWSLACFCEAQTCFEQFYHYTYRTRFGWPKAKAFPIAKLLSRIVPRVLRSFCVIPVYHDPSGLITMREGLKALKRGENMAICPDVDYASNDPRIGEIQTGFLLLAAMYYRKVGRRLPFIPLHCSRKQKRIVGGAPLYLTPPDATDDATRQKMAQTLCDAINRMAEECGDIEESVSMQTAP